MPRIFNFYVIRPERLAAAPDAVERNGARWAQIEGGAAATLERMNELGELLRNPVVREMVGSLSPTETAELHAALIGASPEALAYIEADADLATVYWALRDTSAEAMRRNACMVIECIG